MILVRISIKVVFVLVVLVHYIEVLVGYGRFLVISVEKIGFHIVNRVLVLNVHTILNVLVTGLR